MLKISKHIQTISYYPPHERIKTFLIKKILKWQLLFKPETSEMHFHAIVKAQIFHVSRRNFGKRCLATRVTIGQC